MYSIKNTIYNVYIMNTSHLFNNGNSLNESETTLIDPIDDKKNIIKNRDNMKIIIVISIRIGLFP